VGTGALLQALEGVGFTEPIPAQASLQFVGPSLSAYEAAEGGEVRLGGRTLRLTPPETYAPIEAPRGHGPSAGTVGVAAALAGAALGAGAVMASRLGKGKEADEPPKAKED
jgi:hypothetical protein